MMFIVVIVIVIEVFHVVWSGDTTGTNRKCSSVTGSARKMKDNAADWHNLMLRWERLNDEGFGHANAIVNTRRSDSSLLLSRYVL